jgi:hypothetical protein
MHFTPNSQGHFGFPNGSILASSIADIARSSEADDSDAAHRRHFGFCRDAGRQRLMPARALGRSAVGRDLSYAYLHDQARERLSLTALERWQSGGDGRTQEINLSNLSLFGDNGNEHE